MTKEEAEEVTEVEGVTILAIKRITTEMITIKIMIRSNITINIMSMKNLKRQSINQLEQIWRKMALK